ncbi:MAG: polyphosphate polymerase domain-containing protein [Bacteroidota bacterium]
MTHPPVDILQKFNPVSLDEMDSIRLMNRTDTKFTFHISKLEGVLQKSMSFYRVLEVEGVRWPVYRTIYYDTPGLQLYHAHQNGKLNRYKIRQREYTVSGTCFLETKFKSNKNRTIKKRTRIDKLEESLSERSMKFLGKNADFIKDKLSYVLTNRFNRITLVSLERNERITIDFNLEYERNGEIKSLPYLVIAEIKQEGFSNSTEFIKILRSERVYPSGMSKYCIGILQFFPDIKYNRFKARLLSLNKLKNEPIIASY